MKIEMVFKQIENKKEMKKQTMGEFTMNDEVKCSICDCFRTGKRRSASLETSSGRNRF